MSMMALIRPDGTVDKLGKNIDPNAKTRAGWKWLPFVEVKPNYDSATQVRVGPVRTITATEVTDTWTVRDKNTSETDAEKDEVIAAIDKLQFLIAFDIENRVRVLESKSQITAAQYRAALKARL